MLKKILLVIAIIIAVPLIVALFVKRDYSIEKSITIQRPKEAVYDFIIHVKNQDLYSKWAKMDPQMKKSYSGEDGKVGFISSWDSQEKNVGQGEQEILSISDSGLVMELRFLKPFKTVNNAYMYASSLGENETRVTWGFKGSFPYPMNLMGLFMNMEKAVGNDLDEGLVNLKGILENQRPATNEGPAADETAR